VSHRVYIPGTLADLARWHAAGRVPVTEEWVVVAEADEELEYAALMTAAATAAEMLAGPGRRVVVVADVADPDADAAWRDVAAVHADPEDRPADADPDEDLAWFATQETPHLLG
jgi:hypothetical protein